MTGFVRLVLILILVISGCERSPLSDGDVVHMFGELGMGPGAFSYPRAIALAPDGKLFIVDKTARVQRFDADGTFETSWTMPDYKAGKPVGLAVHPDSRVFVADTHYHRVIVYNADGTELARFGEPGRGDGEFELPTDVAFDANGYIYVSEYNGNDRVTKWSPDFEYMGAIIAGKVSGRVMRRPAAMDIDSEQTLWVADACNHRILRFSLDGELLSEFGTMGTETGQLRYPYDINVDANGRVLVCEFGNCRLQWFDTTGTSLRVWGSPGRDIGQLSSPWGAATGSDGRVYVLDSLNARVKVIRQ